MRNISLVMLDVGRLQFLLQLCSYMHTSVVNIKLLGLVDLVDVLYIVIDFNCSLLY